MDTKLTHLAWPGDEARGPWLALTTSAAVTAAAVLLAAWTLPAVLIVPVASIVLFIAGFAVAIVFRPNRGASDRRLSYGDVAGALVFFGCCAAAFADPDSLVPLLEGPMQSATLR